MRKNSIRERSTNMEKKLNEKVKEQKAITLIALIVTIVVLLILAGVTISALTGENGILTQAQKAKEATEKANKEEERALQKLESEMLTPWSGNIGTGLAGGSGTDVDPYIIENGEQLAYLANQVNNGETYEGKYIKIVKSINLGNIKWTPIGIGSSGTRGDEEWNMTERTFKGNLNGDGNYITGINISELDKHGVGLIGVLDEGGVVENVNIYKGNITGKTCVAGIVGASKGIVKNCSNEASVIAQDDDTTNSGQMAGGIVGWAKKGTIENCRNYGNITTKDDKLLTGRGKHAGGIVGLVIAEEEMTISNCTNSGTVIAVYQQAGGIVASNGSNAEGETLTIKNCTNSGAISTGDSSGALSNGLTGGIIGWGQSETNMTNCTNSGTITTVMVSGGMVGELNIGTISDCSNSGDVSTKVYIAGGIVGWMYGNADKSITNCTNSGTITAGNQLSGGIAGREDEGTISECSNNGDVSTEGHIAGGIVGWMSGNADKSITNCRNSGTITAGNQLSGGIVGELDVGTLSECSNSGDVSTKGHIAGGIVGYMYGDGDKSITNCRNSGTITADIQLAGGIVGRQNVGSVDNCSNGGNIVANAEGAWGIAGGIIGALVGGTVTNVYNSAPVTIGDNSSSTIDAIGGIIGAQYGGSISKCYSKGILNGGDAVGGVVGTKKLAPTVENTYYYTTQDIRGIGSESDTFTEVTAVNDVEGKTKKTTKDIDSLSSFLATEMP